jgi:chorismate-pyruvate lyase
MGAVAPPHPLTRRHFAHQDELPTGMANVDLGELDAVLRCLLFTDGTVTRTLEVQGLSRVQVDVISQALALVENPDAGYLGVPEGTDTVRRRVVISGGVGSTPVIWAESRIVPAHLPPRFLEALDDAPEGIGQSLQQAKLESWRDLLWFGLDVLPGWSGVGEGRTGTAITRLYRVITGGRAALLISETFAVTYENGVYSLDLR